jgi:hypothetical protein
MAVKKNINIGILLDDSKDKTWMRKTLAHDTSLDYVIEPGSTSKMFDYLANLKKKGVKVGKIVMMGHGNAKHPHVGVLQPEDIDLKTLTRSRDASRKKYDSAAENMKAIKAKLAKTKEAKLRKELTNEYNTERDIKNSNRETYNNSVQELNKFRALSGVMAKDGEVHLFNCCPASSDKGREMMKNLGQILLKEKGGKVTGCDGFVWTPKMLQSTLSAVFGTVEGYKFPAGNWVKVAIQPRKKPIDKPVEPPKAGHHHPSTPDAPPATHCNGNNHGPDCQCGWGGPR